MIQEFVERWEKNKQQFKAKFATSHPESYLDIVKAVVEVISDEDEYGDIDPNRIHEIDDGEYQGTLVYVIGANNYQPDDYWSVFVGYGSCSGCDTLQSIISAYFDDPPTEAQIDDYATLGLHIVQGLRKMDDGWSEA